MPQECLSMNAESLILQNWQSLSTGGLDVAELTRRLTEKQQSCVTDWFKQAQLRVMTEEALPSLKQCVDIASWCRFGTDSLADLGFELRTQVIEQASRRFQVSEEVLKILITSTLGLEKCLSGPL